MLRILVDRRRALGEEPSRKVAQWLHHLLELVALNAFAITFEGRITPSTTN